MLAQHGCRGSGSRSADVVLEIARHLHVGRAERAKAAGIDFGLGENQGEAAEETSPNEREIAVAGPGTVGDARVDHGNRDPGAPALDKHTRPELSFEKNEQARAQEAQPGAHGKAEIQRKIKDPLGAKSFARQLLAGPRGGGDHDMPRLRRFLSPAGEFFDQAAGGQHFANGHGVNPNDRLLVQTAANASRNASQPLRQALPVLPAGRHAEKPPGTADNENQEESQAVKEEHSAYQSTIS